jgi:hypothetical protein
MADTPCGVEGSTPESGDLWYRWSRYLHPARFWTIFLCMTNRFGVLIDPDDVRWAAAEGVTETVIAAVLLLHERSVEQIVAELFMAFVC